MKAVGPLKVRWLTLKADSKSKLHHSWRIHLSGQCAPVGRVTENQVRIDQLVMVEEIREHRTEFRIHPLGYLDVLLQTQIDVPERLTAQLSCRTVVALVDSKNRVSEAQIRRLRIRERGGPVAVRAHVRKEGRWSRMVVSRTAESV